MEAYRILPGIIDIGKQGLQENHLSFNTIGQLALLIPKVVNFYVATREVETLGIPFEFLCFFPIIKIDKSKISISLFLGEKPSGEV